MSTPNAALPDRARLTLAETLADSRVMAPRQLRKILRRPTYVVFLFVQPVILVLLFRYVFGGAINTGDVDYVDYLMPGIIVQTAIFGALTTGLGLTEDIAAGVVDRFRSLPIARSAVLIGRTAADIVTNIVTIVSCCWSASRSASARASRSMRSRWRAARAGVRLRLLLDQRVRRAHGARTPRPPSRSGSSGSSR